MIIDPGRQYDADMDIIYYGPTYIWMLEALLGLDHIDWAAEIDGEIFYSLSGKFYGVKNK